MRTVHLVYKFNSNKINSPWSVGNNLKKILEKKYNVITHDLNQIKTIIPNKGDILIGAAYFNPFSIFRSSVDHKNWSKKILIQPFSFDQSQHSHLYNLLPKIDCFISICGDYWFKNLKNSQFKNWKKKMTRIDMAIHTKHYPNIKKKFNLAGKRKFLHIGYDLDAKNINYLSEIAKKYGSKKFSTIGDLNLSGIKSYGKRNLSLKKNLKIIRNYDFLIMTSKYDANPTVILEAMSWGLIPICTPTCGYINKKEVINIPLNDIKKTLKVLKKFDFIDKKKLLKFQERNLYTVKKKYNWNNFANNVFKILKSNGKSYFYDKNYYFVRDTKNSFYLLLRNIYYLFQKIYFSIVNK